MGVLGWGGWFEGAYNAEDLIAVPSVAVHDENAHLCLRIPQTQRQVLHKHKHRPLQLLTLAQCHLCWQQVHFLDWVFCGDT